MSGDVLNPSARLFYLVHNHRAESGGVFARDS
jgi:hypothetical protein